MRALHLWIGGLAVAVFLATGQFLRHHHPPVDTLSDSARLMLRSRHIYILASGLVNLMLGLYIQRYTGGWRRAVQMLGSALLISSTALLVLAFVVEPARGFQPEMPWSALGLYALFGGSMLHVVASIRH